jgi:hypothetical protein
VSKSYPAGQVPPPLPQDDAPLMGNPVLSRSHVRRSTNVGWYVGIPAAVIVLGAGAFFVATQVHQQSGMMATTAPAEQAAAAPAALPVAVAPVPAAPPAQVATATPPEMPVAPPAEITPRPRLLHPAERVHRMPVHQAPAASESGADVSATAPSEPPTLTPPPAAPDGTPPPPAPSPN